MVNKRFSMGPVRERKSPCTIWNDIVALLFLTATIPIAQAGELHLTETCGHRQHAQAPETDAVQYGRGLPVDLIHVKIEIAINMDEEFVTGVVSNTFEVIAEPVSEIALDSVDLDIASVKLSDGTACDFEVTTDKLSVFLPEPLAPGSIETLVVTYSGRPSKGLYFRTQRMGYARPEVQLWSNGEPAESRHWFPTYDFPNDKATSEVFATVEEPFIALSNGEHVSTFPVDGQAARTYHWRQTYPHSTYLITLVIGEFDVVDDSRFDVPILYYVQKGRGDEARLSLGKTPEMIRFFEDKIGVAYPFAKYGQVAVTDFIWGGMENTSLTTLSERTIHDAAAHLTYSSDSLVAHEAAHQWWGNLLTCRDWSHLWLNEGFATYFDALFVEEDKGQEDFQYAMLENARRYRPVDRDDKRGPVVVRPPVHGSGAEAMFGVRVYEKGAWILHMIRSDLGDELFFRAMNVYATRFSAGVVETNDLLRTLEEVSGRSMERFFDQWVYHGGYPEFDIDYSWENETQRARVSLKQTQIVDENTPLFHAKTTIRFIGNEFAHDEALEMSSLEETVYVALPGRPLFVSFDPEGNLLKRAVFKKSKHMLLAQLEKAPSILSRIDAAHGLRNHKTDNVTEALGRALSGDAFWGVRVEAARILGDVDNRMAALLLATGYSQENARIRLAVVEALGNTTAPDAASTLLKALSDDSPYVVAAAIRSLGRLDHQHAVGAITRTLSQDSHNEVIRSAALSALASLRSEKSLGTLIDYTKPKRPRMSRGSSITALGQLGSHLQDKERARGALLELLNDPAPRIRSSVLGALGTLGDPSVIPDLQQFISQSNNQSEKDQGRRAIRRIRSARTQGEEVKGLREELTEFEEAQEELSRRLDDLEAQLKAVKSLSAGRQAAKEVIRTPEVLVSEPSADLSPLEPPQTEPETRIESTDQVEERRTPVGETSGWTVQIGLFSVRDNAEGVKREIDTKSPYVADVIASDVGPGFRVIVGWFETAEAAGKVRRALNESFSFSDSFIRSLNRR